MPGPRYKWALPELLWSDRAWKGNKKYNNCTLWLPGIKKEYARKSLLYRDGLFLVYIDYNHNQKVTVFKILAKWLIINVKNRKKFYFLMTLTQWKLINPILTWGGGGFPPVGNLLVAPKRLVSLAWNSLNFPKIYLELAFTRNMQGQTMAPSWIELSINPLCYVQD